jgi:hypothetical protein
MTIQQNGVALSTYIDADRDTGIDGWLLNAEICSNAMPERFNAA